MIVSQFFSYLSFRGVYHAAEIFCRYDRGALRENYHALNHVACRNADR